MDLFNCKIGPLASGKGLVNKLAVFTKNGGAWNYLVRKALMEKKTSLEVAEALMSRREEDKGLMKEALMSGRGDRQE